jgi:6-phosphogluconolactonase
MDLGTDKVHQYKLDTNTGKLATISEVHMGIESGPRGIVFHPSKRMAYVNCELGGTMVTC